METRSKIETPVSVPLLLIDSFFRQKTSQLSELGDFPNNTYTKVYSLANSSTNRWSRMTYTLGKGISSKTRKCASSLTI